MRYSAFADGFDVKQSATWGNIIKYTKVLCKKYKGHVVRISDSTGHSGASFIWCDDSRDIIPA
jgi:hypothetical protein